MTGFVGIFLARRTGNCQNASNPEVFHLINQGLSILAFLLKIKYLSTEEKLELPQVTSRLTYLTLY
jgi:hypothetical protein